MRLALLLPLICVLGCSWVEKRTTVVFTAYPPAGGRLLRKLRYMEASNLLDKADRLTVEAEVKDVSAKVGVPASLLWCVLFYESQFDRNLNVDGTALPKGIGQLTAAAVEELRQDTDSYDPRTSDLMSEMASELLGDTGSDILNINNSGPHAGDDILKVALILNNRYHRLKHALEGQKISYDPQLLWMYAAAAYRKGVRALFALFNYEQLSRGDQALAHILSDEKAARNYITHPRNTRYPLKKIWQPHYHESSVQELSASMEEIISCALPSGGLL